MSTPEHFLYPERTALSVERETRRFLDAEPIGLNEQETSQLLSWEEPLSAKLEAAVKPSSSSFDIPIDYLLTDDGKAVFNNLFPDATTGRLRLDSLTTLEEAKIFMYENSHIFFPPESQVDAEADEDEEEMSNPLVKEFKTRRQHLREQAEKFATDSFVSQYAAYLSGEITFDQIHDPVFVSLPSSSKKGLARINGLKNLRSHLKYQDAEISTSDEAEKLKDAQKIILKMYQTRVNEYLAESFVHRYGLTVKAEILGHDALTPAEAELLALLPPMSLKNIDRLDKFLEGVEGDIVGENYRQVSERLIAEAKQRLARYEMANIHSSREAVLRQKGLDPEKIAEMPIKAEELKAWFTEIFAAHNVPIAPDKSTDPSQGWRLNVEEGRKTISITGSAKKVNIPASFSRPVYNALPVARHEFGHVLQHENRRTIPLKLFEKRGADRGSVFTEAGGKFLETDLEQEVFGLPPQEAFNVGYIFAIDARLKGGSFKDCFQAFLEPQLRLLDARQLGSPVSDKDYSEERTYFVRESFNRTLRNFRNSFALEQNSPYIGESRAAVYLEQLMLVENLQKIGHIDLAFIARTNFRTLTYLKQLGFLDESQLISEQNIARDVIWPSIKSRFELNPAEPDNIQNPTV